MEPGECGTLSQEENVVCEWKVVIDPVFESIKSPTFCHKGSSVCCLELQRQTGPLDLYDYTTLCLHLESLETGTSVSVKCKATVVIVDCFYPFTRTVKTTTLKPYGKCYLTSFSFNKYENEVCEIRVEVTILPSQPAVQRKDALQTGPRSVTGDLSVLLESGELSDVVLCVGGTEFRAHRLLLSARSPVFAAMFCHDTREAQSSRVDIEDVQPETMLELLQYVYTGSAPGVRKMATRLLAAADKYGLEGLKQLCEDELADNLTVDNAAHVVVTALRHSCDELKRYVLSFIRSNRKSVLASESWADAVRNHSDVATEMSRLIADKPIL